MVKDLGEKYPDKTILDNDPTLFPEKYSRWMNTPWRVQADIGDTSQERVTDGGGQGLLARAYYELATGHDDRSAGFKLLARKGL
jgi:hypothetical protein